MKIIAQRVQYCLDSGKTLHGSNCCTTAIYGIGEQFYNELKNVRCEYDRLNGWNSTLQAAWYIRHVSWTCLFYISFIIWCLWTKPTIFLLLPTPPKRGLFHISQSLIDVFHASRILFRNCFTRYFTGGAVVLPPWGRGGGTYSPWEGLQNSPYTFYETPTNNGSGHRLQIDATIGREPIRGWYSWVSAQNRARCNKITHVIVEPRGVRLNAWNLGFVERGCILAYIYKVRVRDVCDVKSRGWCKLMKRDTKVTQQ